MPKGAKKIKGTEEEWETGVLGTDASYAKVSELVFDESLEEALCLQSISIRLQKGLIEDLKMIAAKRGLGYQPLIKQILRRFADAEIKQFFREHYSALVAEEEPEDDAPVVNCG